MYAGEGFMHAGMVIGLLAALLMPNPSRLLVASRSYLSGKYLSIFAVVVEETDHELLGG